MIPNLRQCVPGPSLRAALQLCALFLLGTPGLSAQTTTTSFSLPVVATFYLDVAGSLAFNTSVITPSDFATGYRQSATDLTITHKGNVPYLIKISTSSTVMGFTPLAGRSDADPGKPVGDVRLSIDNFSTSVALSTVGATLINQGSATGAGSATAKARINLGYTTTPPGTYSTTIVFTVVQN